MNWTGPFSELLSTARQRQNGGRSSAPDRGVGVALFLVDRKRKERRQQRSQRKILGVRYRRRNKGAAVQALSPGGQVALVFCPIALAAPVFLNVKQPDHHAYPDQDEKIPPASN